MSDMSQSGEDAGRATWRDAYLCFCEEITAEQFEAEISADPEISFEALCKKTRLASQCTACLLNAEDIFTRADRTISRAPGAPTSRRKDRPGLRHRLYRIIDRMMPLRPRKVPGIIPVIGGPGVSTILAFANNVPPLIGSRAPAFNVAVEVRDSEGQVVHRDKGTVAPDGRLEFDLTERLFINDAEELTTGGCFLSYQATSNGFIGCIRPHFKVLTPTAVTSVHSAGAGRHDTYLESCMPNPGERQYMSAVNCTNTPANVSMSLISDGRTEPSGEWVVPPMGARLLPVPDDFAGGQVFAIHGKADREIRWHYVVADMDPLRISVDHV